MEAAAKKVHPHVIRPLRPLSPIPLELSGHRNFFVLFSPPFHYIWLKGECFFIEERCLADVTASPLSAFLLKRNKRQIRKFLGDSFPMVFPLQTFFFSLPGVFDY